MPKSARPSTLADYDHELRRSRGVDLVGGVDEAGRGALAGPVVAAAVVLGPEAHLPGVNDSKALRPERREALVPLILAAARAFGLGLATPSEIDRINILQATHLAAARALADLREPPGLLVTDYLHLRGAPAPVLAIKKGDATSLAVAAASVLAKVARDRLMTRLDADFPPYGFARHKGYGTAAHLDALRSVGASCLHRLTFAGVCWFGETPAALPARYPNGEAAGIASTSLLELLRNHDSGPAVAALQPATVDPARA